MKAKKGGKGEEAKIFRDLGRGKGRIEGEEEGGKERFRNGEQEYISLGRRG